MKIKRKKLSIHFESETKYKSKACLICKSNASEFVLRLCKIKWFNWIKFDKFLSTKWLATFPFHSSGYRACVLHCAADEWKRKKTCTIHGIPEVLMIYVFAKAYTHTLHQNVKCLNKLHQRKSIFRLSIVWRWWWRVSHIPANLFLATFCVFVNGAEMKKNGRRQSWKTCLMRKKTPNERMNQRARHLNMHITCTNYVVSFWTNKVSKEKTANDEPNGTKWMNVEKKNERENEKKYTKSPNTHTHTVYSLLWKFSKPEHTDKTRLNVYMRWMLDLRQCRQCRLVCLSRICLNMYDNWEISIVIMLYFHFG